MKYDRVVNKIANKSGESLTETLVALLIAALAMVLLVNMNETSRKLITNSVDTVQEYNSGINDLTKQTSEDILTGTAILVEKTDSSTEVKLDSTRIGSGIPVYYYQNSKSFGTPVMSYKEVPE